MIPALNSPNRSAFLSELDVAYEGTFDFTAAWGNPNPEVASPYIYYGHLALPQQFYDAIRAWGSKAFEVLVKGVHTACQFDEEALYDYFGIPGDYYPQIFGLQHMPPTDMRLDIAVNAADFAAQRFTQNSFRLVEPNAATPSFYWESTEGNALICKHFGVRDPNERLIEVHTDGLANYINAYAPNPRAKLWFSFPESGDLSEDILCFDARIAHWQQRFGPNSAAFVYAEQLVFNEEGCWVGDERVENLFLHMPAEFAVWDEGVAKGEKAALVDYTPWQAMTNLMLANQLFCVPPISSEVLQNKGMMAFLYESAINNIYDPQTCRDILKVVPPTFFTWDEAQAGIPSQMIWEKPILGREGSGVILYDHGEEVYSSYPESFTDDPEAEEWYESMLAVFQEHCPLPRVVLEGEEFELLFTLYISASGRPTFVSCRPQPVGESTTILSGLWLPLSVA